MSVVLVMVFLIVSFFFIMGPNQGPIFKFELRPKAGHLTSHSQLLASLAQQAHKHQRQGPAPQALRTPTGRLAILLPHVPSEPSGHDLHARHAQAHAQLAPSRSSHVAMPSQRPYNHADLHSIPPAAPMQRPPSSKHQVCVARPKTSTYALATPLA